MIKFKKLFNAIPVSLLFLLLVFTNCAEDKELKPIPENLLRVDKSVFHAEHLVIDQNGKQQIYKSGDPKRFIFAQTITKVPLESNNDLYQGFFAGNTSQSNALVRFQFTEKYLNVIKITPYTKSSIYDPESSTSSESVIVRYPIEKYVDIWMAKDDYGDETNKVEETQILNPWHLRKYAVVQFGNEEVMDGSFYFEILKTYWEDDLAKLNSEGELKELHLSDDVINLTIGKTLNLEVGENSPYDKFKPATTPLFEVRSSFLPEPDTNYTPVDYPEEWQRTMGFFHTEIYKDEGYGIPIRKCLLNRFNPKLDNVTFYLSESWSYPHNRKYRELAYKVFDNWNKVFKEATGKDNYFILKDSDGTQRIGDLRYNMIQWIDEVDTARLLGYGPSVVHPETGEILRANTMIYGGALRRSILRARLLHDESLFDFSENEHVDDSDRNLLSEVVLSPGLKKSEKQRFTKELSKSNLREEFQLNYKDFNLKDLAGIDFESKLKDRMNINRTIVKDVLTYKKVPKIKTVDVKDKFLNSKNFILTEIAEERNNLKLLREKAFVAAPSVMPLQKILSSIGKGFTDDEIAEETILGTLTHELGHNFGLRHNFRGSIDKKNFFGSDPEDGAEFLDTDGSPKMHASTIMEYTDDSGHELDRPGKYDIATIKLGYSLDVLPDRKTVDFDYEYCSDWQRGNVDAYCNAFDRGTTAKEIVDNLAHDYHDYYKYRNLSNKYFKKYQIPGDYSGFYSYMGTLIRYYLVPARKFADHRSQRWYELYLENENVEEADNHPEVIDLNEGTIAGFHFLMSVMYNVREDLDKVDPFDFEIDIRGILYDRLYSSFFLSMESVAMFEGDFSMVVTYPDLFDEQYFKDQGYSKEYFFEMMGVGPAGRFYQYDYDNRTFYGDSMMMRPEIRVYLVDLLLDLMDTEGTPAPDHTRISVKNFGNESQLDTFEDETKDAFLNELSTVNPYTGLRFIDYDMMMIGDLRTLLGWMVDELPQIPEDVTDSELKYIGDGCQMLRDFVTADIEYANTLLDDMNAVSEATTPEELASISERVHAFVWRYINSWFLYEDVALSAFDKVEDYLMKVDAEGVPELDEGGMPQFSDAVYTYSAVTRYSSQLVVDSSYYTALDMEQDYSKMELAMEAGVYVDERSFKLHDGPKKRLIQAPRDALITGQAAQKHHELTGVLHLVYKIYELLASDSEEDNRLGFFLMRMNGITSIPQLFDILDFYPGYVQREKDFIYEMFDIYSYYAPGFTWNDY